MAALAKLTTDKGVCLMRRLSTHLAPTVALWSFGKDTAYKQDPYSMWCTKTIRQGIYSESISQRFCYILHLCTNVYLPAGDCRQHV